MFIIINNTIIVIIIIITVILALHLSISPPNNCLKPKPNSHNQRIACSPPEVNQPINWVSPSLWTASEFCWFLMVFICYILFLNDDDGD